VQQAMGQAVTTVSELCIPKYLSTNEMPEGLHRRLNVHVSPASTSDPGTLSRSPECESS
jgi:hypothetical protein